MMNLYLILLTSIMISVFCGCEDKHWDISRNSIRVNIVAFDKSFVESKMKNSLFECYEQLLEAWRNSKYCQVQGCYTIDCSKRNKISDTQKVLLPTGYQYSGSDVKPSQNVMNYERRSLGTLIDVKAGTGKTLSITVAKEFINNPNKDISELTPDTFVKPSIVTLRIEAEISRSKGDVIVGNSSIVADDDKIIFLIVSQ